jgi:hypothetical protein
LVVAYPAVRRLFKLVGFDKAWPIFPTMDEALADDSPPDDLDYKAAI